MKTIPILLLVALFSVSSNLYAQEELCDCKSDLLFLDSKIRKMPAYKREKANYKKAFELSLKKSSSVTSIFDCAVLLNTLMLSINDNHSHVYSLNDGATTEIKENAKSYNTFKNSSFFHIYPKPNVSLDSLKQVLSEKSKTEIEGIYHNKNKGVLGVYKSKDKSAYRVIMLEPFTDMWQEGEIISHMVPYGDDNFLQVGGSIQSKSLTAFSERFEDGFLFSLNLKKDPNQINFSNLQRSDETYYREEISDDISYIKVGSFNSWYPTLSDAETFYSTLDGTLTKKNLIIDLRYNPGGGDRNSNVLFKILKDYSKSNRIFVLTNHETASNAEQFTKKLSDLPNSIILGKTTYGALSYEIKGESYAFPSGDFYAILTSKTHSKYLKYESIGVRPDIELDLHEDWIDQASRIIKETKN